jgi:hypothetical protein
VDLPSLDGPFGCVAAVAMRRDALLENNIMLFERSFELIGAFVVQDVEFGAVGLETCVQAYPVFCVFACSPMLRAVEMRQNVQICTLYGAFCVVQNPLTHL